jgi:hypothetical protein
LRGISAIGIGGVFSRALTTALNCSSGTFGIAATAPFYAKATSVCGIRRLASRKEFARPRDGGRLPRRNKTIFDQFKVVMIDDLRKEMALRTQRVPALST